jgi:hypothetical protein
MRKIPGFLTGLDAAIILSLLAWQERSGVRGNLCEIGVHHGRLFLLLALSRQAGETALAIDLFEDDERSAGIHAGRAGALAGHARRLGIELKPSEVLAGSSLELSAEEILERTGGPIRFFSVDGGHTYQHVENDLRLAHQCISGEGIIAVDDFFKLDWPEVSFCGLRLFACRSRCGPADRFQYQTLSGSSRLRWGAAGICDLFAALRDNYGISGDVHGQPRGARAQLEVGAHTPGVA